jgi:hypothetical protein
VVPRPGTPAKTVPDPQDPEPKRPRGRPRKDGLPPQPRSNKFIAPPVSQVKTPEKIAPPVPQVKTSEKIPDPAPATPPRRKLAGRPKGVPNKINATFKQDLLEAYKEMGGVAWLMEQMGTNPKAVLAIMARLMPTVLQGQDGVDGPEPIKITVSFDGDRA